MNYIIIFLALTAGTFAASFLSGDFDILVALERSYFMGVAILTMYLFDRKFPE